MLKPRIPPISTYPPGGWGVFWKNVDLRFWNVDLVKCGIFVFFLFLMIYDGAMAKQCYFSNIFIVFSYTSCEIFACGASYLKSTPWIFRLRRFNIQNITPFHSIDLKMSVVIAEIWNWCLKSTFSTCPGYMFDSVIFL